MKVEWLDVGIDVILQGENRHTSLANPSILIPGVISAVSGISVDGTLDSCVWARIACLQLVVAASFKESKVSTGQFFQPSKNSWEEVVDSMKIQKSYESMVVALLKRNSALPSKQFRFLEDAMFLYVFVSYVNSLGIYMDLHNQGFIYPKR